MDPFEMPAEMPATVTELNELREKAVAAVRAIQEKGEADPTKVTESDVTEINRVLGHVEEINAATASAQIAEDEHTQAVADALGKAKAVTDPPAPEPEPESDPEGEVIEGEVVEDDKPADKPETKELVTAGTSSRRKISFSGVARKDIPEGESGPGWQVVPGAPGFRAEAVGTRVGFSEMGKALDTVTKGHGVGKLTGRLSGQKMRQPIGMLTRDLQEATDQMSLINLINQATEEIPGYGRVSTDALVAAGGWCAPSEQLYDFCDIPNATDLISLPDLAINRGGLRWPREPDLTSLFENFEFYFTEAQLEAVDGNGDPTAIKHCVEIPCPEDFDELRLNAVGYCVEAGILQRQGWPESIEYVLRALAQEHLRSMSRRTILDMWNGSGAPKVFDAALQVGGTSCVLNSLALMAYNIRTNKGYGRDYPMEIVAPSWFFEVLRADLAMMDGLDTKTVPDSWVISALSARNIVGQFVGDWQTRDVGQPGHLDTVRWPGHVDIIMFPAGTWFRALSNIIEVGVLYPKEQLQINRYTELFTEDSIAVGKRCDRSVNLRIPLKVNGGFGAPVEITYTDTDAGQAGAPVSATPILPSVNDGLYVTTVATTGVPDGGTITLDAEGDDAIIQWNSTAAQAKTAIVDANENWGDNDVTVTGGPLPTALVITAASPVTVQSHALTGGTSPDATATTV